MAKGERPSRAVSAIPIVWAGALLLALTWSASAIASCPNEVFRTGPSARLLDCRAYELVTPEETHGVPISAQGSNQAASGGWFDVAPAARFGENLGVIFSSQAGALPGFGGTGVNDRYEATRGPGGWSTALVGPSGSQMQRPDPNGISADHAYSFIGVSRSARPDEGSLAREGFNWLRDPGGGYQLIGRGEPGFENDIEACGLYITPGGSHIIFHTKTCANLGSPPRLRADAPAAGIAAIYDRTPSGLRTVSLLPGDGIPTEDATYRGVSSDGSVVVFSIGGVLYARLDNANTIEIASGEPIFAGIASGGETIFYLQGGAIFAYDVSTETSSEVVTVADAEPVNISADGSHVYFVSHQQIEGQGAIGEPNLYVWDAATDGVTFITTVDPADLSGTPTATQCLTCWLSQAVAPQKTLGIGPGNEASRATPDGSILVFESHAKLTTYDNEGFAEVYRYKSSDSIIVCVSCSQRGIEPQSDASLQTTAGSFRMPAIFTVDNLTSDGAKVFFETSDPLVQGDTAGTQDVYEWVAPETEGCADANGCVHLISSGLTPYVEKKTEEGEPTGEEVPSNLLYAVSGDGHDVLFLTKEEILPQDHSDNAGSIYDARLDGGFLRGEAIQQCASEECQLEVVGAPGMREPASTLFAGKGNVRHIRRHRRCHRRRHHGRHQKRRCARPHHRRRGASSSGGSE